MSVRCCRCARPSRQQTELQYNAMQVDAFTLLEAARAKAMPQSREHRGEAEFLARRDRSQRRRARRRKLEPMDGPSLPPTRVTND